MFGVCKVVLAIRNFCVNVTKKIPNLQKVACMARLFQKKAVNINRDKSKGRKLHAPLLSWLLHFACFFFWLEKPGHAAYTENSVNIYIWQIVFFVFHFLHTQTPNFQHEIAKFSLPRQAGTFSVSPCSNYILVCTL